MSGAEFSADGGNRACVRQGIAVLLIDANYPHGEFSKKNLNGVWMLGEEKKNISAVLEKAGELDIPVFDVYLSETDGDLLKLQGKNWTHMRKEFMSAFDRTALDAMLKERGIKDLILLGRNQEACLKETAIDAAKLGYKIYTSMDVIQEEADAVFFADDCRVTSDGRTEEVPCRSLVKDSKRNDRFHHPESKEKILVPGVSVTPIKVFDQSIVAFYRKIGTLVEGYRGLPIFGCEK